MFILLIQIQPSSELVHRQDPFAIVNLPTKDDTQRLAFSTLHTQGHIFRPLPVKDYDGRLILPRLYAAQLPNSLVSIKFQLKRQFIVATKSYNYFAEVIDMCVLSHVNVTKDVEGKS